MNDQMKKLPNLPKSLYEEYPAMSAYAHEVAVKEYAQSAMSAAAPPAAAGSVDTPEFRELLLNVQSWIAGGVIADQELSRLVAHLDTWGAQQREAGRHEGALVSLNNYDAACDKYRKQIAALTGRTEKAEAEQDTLKESLRLVNEDHGLWMARTHAAEDAREDALARVKELEERLNLLDTHAAPFGTPIKPTTWR